MKKLAILLVLLFAACCADAQIFWFENFESGSTSGALVTTYTGPNGMWTQTILSSEGPLPNQWYVSCAEGGHTPGGCGTGCSAGAGYTGATLHVGSSSGDLGAAYATSGLCGGIHCVETDRRAESPTINCTGRYTITMNFNYIMNGQAGVDSAAVWYYDGTTWISLARPAQTPGICPPPGGGASPGLWTAYSIALPASADNNPNVKIGFRWVNNNDGTGSNPSFAVDTVTLSASTTSGPSASFTVGSTTACQDSCLTFTNTSTGGTLYTWTSSSGYTSTSATATPVTVCFSVAGVYTMTLTATGGGATSTATHTVTINPAPASIAGASLVCVGHTTTLTDATPGGSWSSSNVSKATVGSSSGIVTGVATGAVTITYTLPATGCIAIHTVTVTGLPCTTGVPDAMPATAIEIYPNPAGNTISLTAEPDVYRYYTVTNDIGQALIKNNISAAHTEVDVRRLPSGLYYLVVSGSSDNVVRKFVKD